MTSIQERQVQRRWYVDEWSTREKLCLASAVLRSGDQNWNAVSRTIKPNADANRPLDWMVPKACANQYKLLLDSVETPKRKKRVAGEKLVESSETAAEYLVRKLTQDHQEDLKKRMESFKKEYYKVKSEIEVVESGNLTEEDLDKLIAEMDLDDEKLRQKEEECKRFLIEREQKKRDYERPLWKSPSVAAAQAAALKSNVSDKTSESGSSNEAPEAKPASAPTSPLLTSLLQSPSPLQRSSVLSTTPTISNLLNSAPAIPHFSNDSPTLTKLLECRTSPRSTSSSLIDNNIANKTDLHSKQGVSAPHMMSNQSVDSQPQLNASPRLNKSPIRRTPPRSDVLSTPMRVDSNPDISNVVRCLYMEDVDKKACVGIERTQLLLNQANVDLSKVDEQKLQDEIVDMIVEQQGTDGMNISNMTGAGVTPSGDLSTVVKLETPEPDSSLQVCSKAGDSNIVVLDCDITRSVMDNSQLDKQTGFGDGKIREIKIEPDIPVEIAGSGTLSRSISNTSQSTNSSQASQIVPTVIDVETTQSLSLSQAEISVVGISQIKSEPNLNEPDSEDNDVSAAEEVSKPTQPKSTPKRGQETSTASSGMTTQGTSSIAGAESHTNQREAQTKGGNDSKKDESAGDLSENVIILDTNIELSSSMANDIIIDNDTEVIIAKDDSLKGGLKPDDKLESDIVIKEESEDSELASELSKAKSDEAQQSGKNNSGPDEIFRDKSLDREESSRHDSKKLSKPDPSPRANKHYGEMAEKPESESRSTGVLSKRAASSISERKGTNAASEKKETEKKIISDEDEVTNDGDDEEDSDEQILSSLKRTVSSSDKKLGGTRNKSLTNIGSNISAVTDFVDTSSDTHSTGGDDSESTSTSISLASRVNKKTSSREKRDSINSTTSSSSHHNAHEEKGLRAWKKSIMLSYNGIATHKYASLFLKPITEDQAPGYHNIVKQPIDLLTIKKNIENGTLRTTLDFQRAIMLMFTNALFFNWHGSEVYKMTFEMMQDTLGHIQLLVQTMGEGMPYAQSDAETPEKQVRTERVKRSAGTPAASSVLTPLGTKRKRSGFDSSLGANLADQTTTPFKRRR